MEINIFVLLLLIDCARSFSNDTIETPRILSRRRRFLLYPEGSSFQLVFCVQTAALIPIGDIFLYGNTAALAWTLPTDSKLLYALKGHTRDALRRGDQEQEKKIVYLDEQGKVIAKVPYKRKQLINPVFAKRSVDGQVTYRNKLKWKIDRQKMHTQKTKEDYLQKKGMHQNSIEFHRSSRLSLFEKLESLFSALGQDGRQCVLHKLCKAGQPYRQQGTFLQETLRTIFTLPKGSADEEYDKAHTAEECDTVYPGCEYLQHTNI